MTSCSYTSFLPDLESTQQLGFRLGRSLPVGTTLLLEGDLGAGKTTLIQSLGVGLGITEPIVSPTFTLINEYHEGRIPLYHLDLYRLQPENVASLFLENYCEGLDVPLGIVAIEWAQRLPQPPDDYIKVDLCHESEGRQVKITLVGSGLPTLDWLRFQR
ncbi:MAG: tRNA (adenosine(37)-N6)-threonylcarbamoyltransferase complex ATPase subunit type 1 TsaE [Cyanobacteria bacterium P01_F01_bin.42]